MADVRKVRQGLLVVAVAAASAFAAFAVAAGPAPTDAAWVVTRTLNVTATAVTPAPPPTLTCPGSGIGGSVVFTWTAPAGAAPSGYTVVRTGAAAVQVSGLTISIPPPPLLGSFTVRVYSDYGSSWQSVASSPPRTVNSLIGLWNCG